MSVTFTAAGQTQQLTATFRDSSNNQMFGVGAPQWSSSDPTVATVNGVGLVTAVGGGTATITATLQGVSGSTTVSAPPLTPVQFAKVFNAIDPNVQIEHDWEVGYGHSLTAGFKADIVDQVGGGTDGVLHAVPDQVQGAGSPVGMYYDPGSNTFKFTDGTTNNSSKVVFPTDFKQTRDTFTVEIGTWMGAGGFVHQSIIDDGAGGTTSQIGIGDAVTAGPSWPNPSGNRNVDFFSVDRPYTGVMWRQHNNALAELQWGWGRDIRIWTPRGTALTTARTWRHGGELGHGVDTVGDRRKWFSGRGIMSHAHIKLINDYAVARLGVPEDVRKMFLWDGDSIITFFPSQLYDALGHATWAHNNNAVGGATLDDMAGRFDRLTALARDDGKRPRFVFGGFDLFNQLGVSVGAGDAAFVVNLIMQKYRDYMDHAISVYGSPATTSVRYIWFTSPAFQGSDDVTYRQAWNTAVRNEVTSRGGSAAGHYLCDWGNHPIMGQLSALPTAYGGNNGGTGIENFYYDDNVHPSSAHGIPALINDANMLKATLTAIG